MPPPLQTNVRAALLCFPFPLVLNVPCSSQRTALDIYRAVKAAFLALRFSGRLPWDIEVFVIDAHAHLLRHFCVRRL